MSRPETRTILDQLFLSASKHPMKAAACRCPIVFLIDTSASMQKYIPTIEKSLLRIIRCIFESKPSRDVPELGIYAFDTHVQTILPLEERNPNSTQVPHLKTECGSRRIGEAIYQAIAILEQRLHVLQDQKIQLNVPLLFVITDGKPDGSEKENATLTKACALIRKKIRMRQLDVIVIGLGKHADSEVLFRIAGGNIGRPPLVAEHAEAAEELLHLLSMHLSEYAGGMRLSGDTYREQYHDFIRCATAQDYPAVER